MSWKLLVVAAIVGALVLFMRLGRASPQEAREVVKNGGLLLDVRTREEFAAGHIEGALNVPVQELDSRLEELGAKDRPVVVYCRSGARSARAKRMLEGAGFQTVLDIGPMSAW